MSPITVTDGDTENAKIFNATGIADDESKNEEDEEEEEEEEHVREMIEVSK